MNRKGAQSTTEATVIELHDGSLMLNMRNHYKNGCRAVSTTKDMGKTWSEITFAAALPEPVCQANMIRYTSARDGLGKNRILFSNPSKSPGRANMTVKMSYDEGKTWPVSRTIHTGPSAYSCMTILPDGSIGLFYEHGDKKSPYDKMKFVRFSLEWLTDGKDKLGKASAKSYQLSVVSKKLKATADDNPDFVGTRPTFCRPLWNTNPAGHSEAMFHTL